MKDPLIGQQLANFRVERLLGHGGMASVYYGQDIKLQRPVAIKVIDKKYKNDPVYNKRFINEARMMAKWRHENIIQIYYADEEQGYSYYAMEYVDGQDLASVMGLYAKRNELMSIKDVLRIGHAIANALDYAHGQGVIHRDIKPSNILIARDGRVLLGDFGMALEMRDGSMGNIFGTPHYISPEQARRSADAVPQSDLYSLGVILFEVLTGSVPFDDPSPASVALQHITQEPPPPRSLNPELPVAVETILLKALKKDPKERYQSGQKLMAALEEAFDVKGSSAKIPLPPLPVGVPTIRRSALTVSQIANRAAPKAKKHDRAQQPAAPLPATARSSHPPRKRNTWLGLLLILLLLVIGGWYYAQNRLPALAVQSSPTLTSSPPASLPDVQPVQPTQTLIPPSATPTESATPTPAPTPTEIIPTPTIKYPDGNHFTLFWNATSFHMLNRSRSPRSLSAFVFQRLDENGQPTDAFTGSRWENTYYKYIPAKGCVSIKIYGDENPPYINPHDCYGNYISIVQPRKDEDRELLFWNPKNDGSHEFRILFAGEEIARCQISAGTCELYVP